MNELIPTKEMAITRWHFRRNALALLLPWPSLWRTGPIIDCIIDGSHSACLRYARFRIFVIMKNVSILSAATSEAATQFRWPVPPFRLRVVQIKACLGASLRKSTGIVYFPRLYFFYSQKHDPRSNESLQCLRYFLLSVVGFTGDSVHSSSWLDLWETALDV